MKSHMLKCDVFLNLMKHHYILDLALVSTMKPGHEYENCHNIIISPEVLVQHDQCLIFQYYAISLLQVSYINAALDLRSVKVQCQLRRTQTL